MSAAPIANAVWSRSRLDTLGLLQNSAIRIGDAPDPGLRPSRKEFAVSTGEHQSARPVRRKPDVTLEFGNDTGAPSAARRAMKGLLNDTDDPISVNVELVTSELVANVVVHTADGGVLRAWDPKPDVPLRLEVEDYANDVPAVVAAPPAAGGRGLHIVDGASDAWGVHPLEGGGKVVWAEFDRSSALRGSGKPNVPKLD